MYISSNGGKLPIVIDTGASNSIISCPTEFIEEIKRSNLQSLKQVNGKTPVCKEGKILWDIGTFYGTRRSVTTESYFVPSASISLFSSQVYTGTNNTAKMTLDRSGL